MGDVAKTKERYLVSDLSARKLYALIVLQNTLVKNTRTLAAKLDADGTVVTATYAAGLTAKEVNFSGYTPVGTATTEKWPHPAQQVAEGIVRDALEQFTALVTDWLLVKTKLNADAGVEGTDYAVLAQKYKGLGKGTAGTSQDLPRPAGAGVTGLLLQQWQDQLEVLLQDVHNITNELDAPRGVPGVPAAGVGNTGDGTCEDVVSGFGAPTEDVVATAKADATKFDVVGTVSGALGEAEVDVPFVSDVICFTITQGGTEYVTGDTWTIGVVAGTGVTDTDYEDQITAAALTAAE